MEIVVFPRGFAVQSGQVPTPTGQPADAMVVLAVDAGGAVVKIVFALPDWEQFQRAVADPVAFTETAKARARILGPDGRAPTLKERKH